MSDNYKQTFNVIRRKGTPNEAVTTWGWTAHRMKEIYVDEPYFAMIPCLDYDNHFIYEVPWKPEHIGTPGHMCTCGSQAFIVGIKAYEKDASPMIKSSLVEVDGVTYEVATEGATGMVFACYFRNILRNTENGDPWGKHADGST